MEENLFIEQLLKVLPKLVRENDTVKGAIITALSGVIATKEDKKEIIREMDKRFEASDKRFEAMDKRFEAMDKRFEAMNKRFDESDKKNEERFQKLMQSLDSIQSQIGKPFEQFARNVIIRILDGEGQKKVELNPIKIKDSKRIISPDSDEVEIDGFSENPPIVVEITSILRNKEKVEKFIQKKILIEKLKKQMFRGFFIASGSELSQNEKADIILLLKNNNCELINL
jgi:hypothetical protein